MQSGFTDNQILKETLRVWKATRINGASMSMVLSGAGNIDTNLMIAFDEVARLAEENKKPF